MCFFCEYTYLKLFLWWAYSFKVVSQNTTWLNIFFRNCVVFYDLFLDKKVTFISSLLFPSKWSYILHPVTFYLPPYLADDSLLKNLKAITVFHRALTATKTKPHFVILFLVHYWTTWIFPTFHWFKAGLFNYVDGWVNFYGHTKSTPGSLVQALIKPASVCVDMHEVLSPGLTVEKELWCFLLR